MRIRKQALAAAVLCLGWAVVSAGAHEASHFSAGEPGNKKKPARTVTVIMREGDGIMQFVPDRIDVRKGDQVRFILQTGACSSTSSPWETWTTTTSMPN